jgi:hypothetical protein
VLEYCAKSEKHPRSGLEMLKERTGTDKSHRPSETCRTFAAKRLHIISAKNTDAYELDSVPPKAITAMAHQLARIIWTLITRQVPSDLSLFAEQEKLNEQRRFKHLAGSARQMDYQLTPVAA